MIDPELDARLVALLDARPGSRARALRGLGRADVSLYAVRAVLFFDERAALRAKAARKLGRWRDVRAVPWLCEATRDPFASVRESAWRALSRFGHPGSVALALAATREEPVWWVRRAAVVAYALSAGFGALAGLCEALEDPFWRVRRAAVRCLAALGDASPEVRAALRAQVASAPRLAADALRFLGARWSGEAVDVPVAEPLPARGWIDEPDPAVLTARLERVADADLDPRDLVGLLADSHVPLRAEAVRRLVRCANDPRAKEALRACLRWIDEHRVPHAKETTWSALRRCGAASVTLAREVLDRPAARGAGSLAWAIETLAREDDSALAEKSFALLGHESPAVRVAALRALGDHGSAPAEVCIARLNDADERVRDAAAEVLQGLDGALAALRAAPVSRFGTRVRSLFVGLAWRARDESWLRALAAQDHPWVRGLAFTALRELGALAPEELTVLAHDADPWIRAAAIDATRAPGMFVSDPDPELRRAALERVLVSRRSVTDDVRHAAVSSRDAWVRARAPSLLDARTDEGMRALVTLFRDPSLAVRSAALDALDAAHATARALASISITARTVEPSPRPVVTVEHPRNTTHSRPLGDTGLRVSPLGISGVYELPSRGYAMAEERGVNLFFWEPRYTRLTRYLRRAPSHDARVIVAGSFHATEAAIARDIERALVALGRDHLDVFLLFWTRSRERLNDETLGCLERARRAGKVRSIGFSTHDRALATEAVTNQFPGVVMIRHNAAHTGAERTFFPAARAHGTGVIAFSALCYGRLLQPTAHEPAPTAGDCYRYVLSQPGVATCLSAPRNTRELTAALEALDRPTLDAPALERMRAHGRAIYAEERAFGGLVRGVTGAAMIRGLLEDGEALDLTTARQREKPTPGFIASPVHLRRFLR